jgi:hypothetical protein
LTTDGHGLNPKAEIRNPKGNGFDANFANFHELTKRDLTTEPMLGSKQPKLGLPRNTDKKRIG